MNVLNFFVLFVITLAVGCSVDELQNHAISENSVESQENLYQDPSLSMSFHEVSIICNKLANFRDQLDGVMDPRLNEGSLIEVCDHYDYVDLLHIVKKYGESIGKDKIFTKCVKILYFFNDGEYGGWIDDIIPESTKMCKDHDQNWLIES
jgi:hypothetical protein